jgi:hypothetical protein
LYRTLTKINLCRNKIGDAGASYIAKALESNSTLTTIYLDGNGIGGRAGSFAMTDAVLKNPLITSAFTPPQIVTVLWIHGGKHQRQRDGKTVPIDKLPYDVIRRILASRVNEKRRVWDGRTMTCKV